MFVHYTIIAHFLDVCCYCDNLRRFSICRPKLLRGPLSTRITATANSPVTGRCSTDRSRTTDLPSCFPAHPHYSQAHQPSSAYYCAFPQFSTGCLSLYSWKTSDVHRRKPPWSSSARRCMRAGRVRRGLARRSLRQAPSSG
jgi:hypothetical protein